MSSPAAGQQQRAAGPHLGGRTSDDGEDLRHAPADAATGLRRAPKPHGGRAQNQGASTSRSRAELGSLRRVYDYVNARAAARAMTIAPIAIALLPAGDAAAEAAVHVSLSGDGLDVDGDAGANDISVARGRDVYVVLSNDDELVAAAPCLLRSPGDVQCPESRELASHRAATTHAPPRSDR
jgi:hypothetical protein